MPSLRRKDVFAELHGAVLKARSKGLRIIHYAVLSNHVHLILELPAPQARLSPALQSLTISLARRLNQLHGSRGPVFLGRYHLHVLRTPREVRHALRYVLMNEGHHRKQRIYRVSPSPFSSAAAFVDWPKLIGRRAPAPEPRARSHLHSAWLYPPGTWLLRYGWMRAV
jgi:REP element-mobilizing transposase RayT